ncbi:MAG: type IV pilus assembly protein PilM [Bdellovibrionales bacterium]|nr:type IV pilus assembly protein PilM [Bdellovibrionales bacterium]
MGGGLAGLFKGLSSGSAKSAIGLSIGSSSIKLVELKKSKENWKLLHFGMVALPQDSIVNREIVNPVAVTENLKTLLSQLKLQSKKVCISISGNSVILKRMQLEVPNMKELQEQVFWEAEQYLPFDVSEVVMDYQLLSRGKDGNADVLLVAAKRSILDTYMACVEDAGLDPAIVDVDFFAIENAFESNYTLAPGESALVVDIGATAMKMVILKDGVPVFTKDSALGGQNLTAEIQKHLRLSYADAETLKTGAAGGALPQEVSDLMQVMSENLGREIKRSLDFYAASSSGAPVSTVVLAGGGAKIPGLSRVVEDIIQIPTQVMNPFNAISYDPAVFTQEYVTSIGPIAATPIGLALRAGGGR